MKLYHIRYQVDLNTQYPVNITPNDAVSSLWPLVNCNSTLLNLQYIQWLKCNGTQGNAVPPPSNLWLKAFNTSDRYNQGRSQRGTWVHVPRHRRSVFVTAPLMFSMVAIFCPWTPLGSSVPRPPGLSPLSKFLATPLVIMLGKSTRRHSELEVHLYTTMRYINRRFTYLLTYLLTYEHRQGPKPECSVPRL